LHENDEVKNAKVFESLVARRAMHEPYEYIVGKASFYDIELSVEQGVLIPRPETELLIDHASKIIQEKNITRIVEIGVGSGAISVVLARKFPDLQIIATDICDIPLRVALRNIEHFGMQKQITLIKSNLMDEIKEDVKFVISNPPYIAENFTLEPNVANYEPKEALFGGKMGDELLKQIIVDAQKKGVDYLVCEMGYDQKLPLQVFANEIGVKYIDFYQDLSGLDRGFIIRFNKENNE
ncbi:MAG: Peptide chain release factor N(5)-glutamine methyltransferase, partial [Campylobacterota bacterium]|nr:Peptide chain release factor N(5)-glutamine methyltransferase [Campylobacterota bacterium]